MIPPGVDPAALRDCLDTGHWFVWRGAARACQWCGWVADSARNNPENHS